MSARNSVPLIDFLSVCLLSSTVEEWYEVPTIVDDASGVNVRLTFIAWLRNLFWLGFREIVCC